MRSHCWVLLAFVCITIAPDTVSGHGSKTCCNGNKILDTIQRVLSYGRHKGDNQYHKRHFVAFSAYLGSSSFTASHNNQRVNFNVIKTDYGNAYKDGIFTSPINGLYAFHWTIATAPRKVGDANLAVNGKGVRYGGLSRGGSTYGTASSSAVLQLKRGDTVWIYTYKNHYIHRHHSSFQGWLLQEI